MTTKDLRKRRFDLHLTQIELAQRCNVTLRTVQRWESGHRKCPGLLNTALDGIELEQKTKGD